MGIPGLTARLAPYASPIKWERLPEHQASECDKARDLIIIDGPALAYHIYHRCLREHGHAKNAFDAFPSYGEVSQTLLAWLEQVEECPTQVHKIYFDGYLPQTKQDVRHSRLQSYLKQLRLFRSARLELQPSAPPQPPTNRRAPVGTPAVPTTAPARLYALPAPPFLVPVVIETLLGSKYSGRTHMRPSEADSACAAEAVSKPNSIILTSDSDLLVHCEDGRVMFFNELDLTHGSVLKGRTYRSNEIAKDHKCDSFRAIAYHMAQDTQRTIGQAAKLVNNDREQACIEAKDWFNANLAVGPKICALLADRYPQVSDALSDKPDPRLSELLCERLLLPDKPDPSIDEPELRMYLPFLIDDPTRASAWRASSRLRAIAYTCLNLKKQPFKLFEVDRRAERILTNTVSILEKPELVGQLEALQHSLDKGHEEANAVTVLRKWAVVEVIGGQWLDSGSSQISLDEVQELTIVDNPKLSWNAVHFKAQVEGLLYSLRMVDVVLQLFGIESSEGLPHQSLDTLREHLAPVSCRTADTVTSPNQGLPIEDADGRFRHRLCEIFSVDPQDLQSREQSMITETKGSKKRRRQERSGKQPQKKRDERNMYNILAES